MYCADALSATGAYDQRVQPLGSRDKKTLLELYVAGQLLGTLIEQVLSGAGLPPHLFGLLHHVKRREPVPPSVIAEEEGIPPTTIRDNVERLVRRGLLERRPNPSDRRSYLLALTPAGHALADAIDPALARAYRELERRLPRPLDEYDASLEELQAAMRAALGSARGQQAA
jgi:DNA-binding MarR family transcriptional regulator